MKLPILTVSFLEQFFVGTISSIKFLYSTHLKILVLVAFATTTAAAKRKSRRPTKPREKIVVPTVSCEDLFQATIDIGDDGPLIRKTHHNLECKKYFECVTNHWLARDCPDGTTFNLHYKGCDTLKTCKPSELKELYEKGIAELKEFMGIDDDDKPADEV